MFRCSPSCSQGGFYCLHKEPHLLSCHQRAPLCHWCFRSYLPRYIIASVLHNHLLAFLSASFGCRDQNNLNRKWMQPYTCNTACRHDQTLPLVVIKSHFVATPPLSPSNEVQNAKHKTCKHIGIQKLPSQSNLIETDEVMDAWGPPTDGFPHWCSLWSLLPLEPWSKGSAISDRTDLCNISFASSKTKLTKECARGSMLCIVQFGWYTYKNLPSPPFQLDQRWELYQTSRGWTRKQSRIDFLYHHHHHSKLGLNDESSIQLLVDELVVRSLR